MNLSFHLSEPSDSTWTLTSVRVRSGRRLDLDLQELCTERLIDLIPLVLGVSIFTLITNGLLTFWRVYKPWLLLGAVFATIGNVKISFLDADSSTTSWIGYTLMVGIASAAIYSVLVPISKDTGLTLADLNAGTGYAP